MKKRSLSLKGVKVAAIDAYHGILGNYRTNYEIIEFPKIEAAKELPDSEIIEITSSYSDRYTNGWFTPMK